MQLHKSLLLVAALAVSACAEAPTSSPEVESPRMSINPVDRVEVWCDPVIYVGSGGYCSATAYDTANNPVYGSASWSSSNPGSVTVSSFGGLSAVAPGGAWITARIGGVSGSDHVDVAYFPVLTTISVTPNPTSVVLGGQRQLTASAFDQYGAPMSGVSFTWSSSSAGVATVSGSGLVTGVALGSASVTASSGGVSGSSSVSVVSPPLSVWISGKQYVARYESAQYTASASGGTTPYTYQWRSRQGTAYSWGTWQNWYSTGSTPSTYASISSCGLDRNQLEVRVTDATGATSVGSYTIYLTNPC